MPRYCNITYYNTSQTQWAVDMVIGRTLVAFPTDEDFPGCLAPGASRDQPPSGAVAVMVSKMGPLLFLISMVAMML